MATQENDKKSTKLSKNLLQMKFMRRTAVKQEMDENELEKKRIIDDEHWVLDIPEQKQAVSKYIMEPSNVVVEGLPQFGRLSFKGFNPEIEKLMTEEEFEAKLNASEEREKLTAVDDEEMVERFENIVGTIAKKFTKKRNRTKGTESSQPDSESPQPTATKRVKKETSKTKTRKFLKPDV
ncbi:M-phase phosphoprotein 6-like [Tubulanus polymorphus]|uniref:M-phase phosphoprotein 6-like n=1 Tax=Tubulanus polymorphus TaxID=672921 RepID=UPI003DA28C87